MPCDDIPLDESVFREAIDDAGNSQQGFSFSTEQSAASGQYWYKNVREQGDLQDQVTKILGDTATNKNYLALSRTVPKSHPIFPYLYASQITGLSGSGLSGGYEALAPVPPIPATPITDTFGLYKNYSTRVAFASRPYNILPDEEIDTVPSQWYPPPVFTTGAGDPAPAKPAVQTFRYANEWIRYTDWTLTPQSNNVEAPNGALTFKDIPLNGNPATSTASPFMFLPDAILTFIWYQVPLRYVTSPNSYIANRGWRGKINQNPWYNWDAGQLLYLNYEVKRYNQSNSQVQTNTDRTGSPLVDNEFDSYAKLCDITFTFLHTTRTGLPPLVAPFYENWIPKGHNLLPYLPKRLFSYASTQTPAGAVGDPTAYQAPPWNSFPLELMFTEPDIPQI